MCVHPGAQGVMTEQLPGGAGGNRNLVTSIREPALQGVGGCLCWGEGWPWAVIPEEANISRFQPVSFEMLDRVALVGKESGQTTWAKITWLRLLSNLVLGWKGCRGTEKDQVWGCVCVCKSHPLHSLQEQKKVDAYSADISNHGREPGLASQGMPFPFVCLFCFKQATVIAKSWPGVESEINHALKLFTIILHHLLSNPLSVIMMHLLV